MKVWKKRSILTWVQVLIIGYLCVLGEGVASAATEKEGNKTDYAQAGDLLLWLEQLDTGLKKLVVQHQLTGKIIDVTDGSTAVDAPFTDGEWIVWADKGNEPISSLNWEIHGYHVPSGQKQKLSSDAGIYGNPTVDQYGVVWYKRSTYGEMIYRDLQTGLEFSLGEGRFPVLVDRKVVYKNARDGGLSMLNLSTGVKRNLVTLGSTYYIDWFVFNGSQVLAKKNDGTGNSQYVAIQATAPAVEVTELTQPTKESISYNTMFISQQYAVYIQLVEGSPTLYSVDHNTMTQSQGIKIPANTSVVGIQGDRLLIKHENGTVSEVPINKPIDGNTPPPITPPLDKTETSGYIDGNGGTIRTEDGAASVTFPQGAFAGQTRVSLSQQQLGGAAYDEAGQLLQFASDIFKLELASLPLKAATLSVAIGDAELKRSLEKLAIYRFDEGKQVWIYIGGMSDLASHVVQTEINEPGQYAVMLRNITFADIKGHWSQQAVEVLAAHGIVNGISANSYAAGQTLTRAEFTKLLASAIGLKQKTGTAASFTDVKASAWYYGWVEAAAEAGIVQGDKGLFKPDDALTREQMMAMLIRAAGEQINNGVDFNMAEVLAAFEDEAKISNWAKLQASHAVHLGLIEGANGRLDPQGITNRAQAAMVIYRLYKQLNSIN